MSQWSEYCDLTSDWLGEIADIFKIFMPQSDEIRPKLSLLDFF